MKRFITTLGLCFSLLLMLSYVLFRPVSAKEDVLTTLLNLPAPPPPNPLAQRRTGERPQSFYNKSRPPADDAPIEDLLDYWRFQSENHPELGYNPVPSDRVVQRLKAEIESDPKKLSSLMESLPDSSAEFIKSIYDREASASTFDKDERHSIKNWLTYHSPYFSSELARMARQAGDQGEYVNGQNEILALAKVDFDQAKPIIDRLMSGGKKASNVLASWAMYTHALETNSTADIERYRNELKAVVEDKSATGGMRDLALDALVKEKEWTGRDDWYLSLLSDETLADLKVNGASYTGLTTIIYYSSDERYAAKMLELIRSENPAIRTAAIKNLVLIFSKNHDPEIVRALLPWLEDPKWATDTANTRSVLVSALTQIQVPESVPGLIKILDEKSPSPQYAYAQTAANMLANTANTATNAMNAAAYAMNAAANAANSNQRFYSSNSNTVSRSTMQSYNPMGDGNFYPYRSDAIRALAKQKDAMAVPALRRILNTVNGYERNMLVSAILACRGFTVPEQLDALDVAAKGVRTEIDGSEIGGIGSNSYAVNLGPQYYYNAVNAYASNTRRPPTEAEIRAILAQQIVVEPEISDDLAEAMVGRIESLDKKDPRFAAAYRKLALKWKNAAINSLFIRDLRRGAADSSSIVRLLSMRKELREGQGQELSTLATGKPIAIGISPCLFEDFAEFRGVIEKGDAEAKIAMLACSRLIRFQLNIAAITPMLKSENKMLALAAERYLESTNTVEAAKAIYARHPGEAVILGATTAYIPNSEAINFNEQLSELFQSVDNNNSIYDGWIGDNAGDLRKTETRLQTEIKQDANLAGIYAYDRNFIRIYKDNLIFTWEEEPSRYRERVLKKEEFDGLKAYLADNRVDELPPFLTCGGEYCEPKELLMLGRDGGKRVFMNGPDSKFFGGLENYFKEIRRAPAAIKYALSKELAGLEILFANDEMHAETVWKNGDDLRVVASSREVRKRVASEIENAADDSGNDDATLTDEARADRVEKLRYKLQFQGFGWFKLAAGKWSATTQPAQIPFIPFPDPYAVSPDQESWKAKAGDTEIRAGDEGLFKVSRGKMTKLRDGSYSSPVISANGKWLVAAKSGDDSGSLVRLNLLTGKEFSVAAEDMPNMRAAAFVPAVGKFLIVAEDYEGEGEGEFSDQSEEEDDWVENDPSPETMMMLDPETGKIEPAIGELRPLTQQTFRPLQNASRPGEFWAAIPDTEKNETRVGIWNSRTLQFRQVLRIPEITFNSMGLWADEPGGKLYFVYRGHMLSLPIPKSTPPAR